MSRKLRSRRWQRPHHLCGGAAARRHGIAPVRSDHPAYPYMRDPDADGVVCE